MKTLVTLLLCLLATTAQALDFSAQVGVGPTLNQRSDVNGIWYQDRFPHEFAASDIAWKSGAMLHHGGWTLQANYVDLGSFGVRSRAVHDHEYDFHANRCMVRCDSPDDYSVRNDLHGVEIKLGHRWQWDRVSLGVNGGGAVLFHKLTVDVTRATGRQGHVDFDGTVGALVGAGEACYTYGLSVCGEVSYYHKIAENHNPLMGSGVVVPMILGRYTF